MTSQVHEFDAREGGRFRISLTYDEPTGTGKSSAHTDTYHGHFVKLVPNERVVEVMEFETNPGMQGEMTVSYLLSEADGGTELLATHEGLPPAFRRTTTKRAGGWHWTNLAALVEAGE